MRDQQRGEARCFVHDAALEADGGIAGVHAAADAIRREQCVEFRQQLGAGHRMTVQRHRFAADETDAHLQRRFGPFAARRAPAARAFARRFPAVDLAAGHRQAEQVLVDRVCLLLGAHAEAALLEIGLFVGAGLGVFLLDFADRRDDREVAAGLDREIETHLIVAHAGATVGDDLRAESLRARQGGVDDQITVGDQQRILALVGLAGPDERLDEAVPQRRAAVDGDVRCDAELLRAVFDERALLGVDAAGIGEHGMHRPALFLQIGHAETGVEAAGECENDVFGLGHGLSLD